MPKAKEEDAAALAFRHALDAASHLQWKAGLQAIKKSEGGGQIEGAAPNALLGSAAIDEDCLKAHPSASRWDYVIGYRRNKKAIAYFVEVHSAETSQVSKIESKLRWLREFLLEETQSELAHLPREIHWVASGRINIPKHLPQFKRLETTLRKLGLKGPTKQLVLT